MASEQLLGVRMDNHSVSFHVRGHKCDHGTVHVSVKLSEKYRGDDKLVLQCLLYGIF